MKLEYFKNTIWVILFFVSSINIYAEWTELGVTEGDDHNYVDLKTMRRIDGKIRIWSMMDYKQPKKWGNIVYSSSKSLEELDCNAETQATISGRGYSGNIGSGNPIYTFSPKGHEPVIPDTIGAYMMNYICSLESLRKKD